MMVLKACRPQSMVPASSKALPAPCSQVQGIMSCWGNTHVLERQLTFITTAHGNHDENIFCHVTCFLLSLHVLFSCGAKGSLLSPPRVLEPARSVALSSGPFFWLITARSSDHTLSCAVYCIIIHTMEKIVKCETSGFLFMGRSLMMLCVEWRFNFSNKHCFLKMEV